MTLDPIVDLLAKQIARDALVVVLGAMDSGKSTFVRALGPPCVVSSGKPEALRFSPEGSR